MLDVEGVDIEIKPSLFEMALDNDDYEMMKLLINSKTQMKHHDYISELRTVNNSKCLFREHIKYKSVNFLCALVSSTRLTVTE